MDKRKANPHGEALSYCRVAEEEKKKATEAKLQCGEEKSYQRKEKGCCGEEIKAEEVYTNLFCQLLT